MTSSPPSSLELLTDEQLVSRAQSGGRDAFNHLVLRHERRLFRFLCKSAANPADIEDAMQQALFKAYTKLAQYNPKWRFTTWLFTIAVRELRSLRHRPGPTTTPLDTAQEPAAPKVAPTTDPNNPDDLWRTARRLLKPQHYSALWLRYGEDLPARDIAKILGRPRIWVSVTLHRACALLRQNTTNNADQSKSPDSKMKPRPNQKQQAQGIT